MRQHGTQHDPCSCDSYALCCSRLYARCSGSHGRGGRGGARECVCVVYMCIYVVCVVSVRVWCGECGVCGVCGDWKVLCVCVCVIFYCIPFIYQGAIRRHPHVVLFVLFACILSCTEAADVGALLPSPTTSNHESLIQFLW